jgi:hypothetical protein
LPEADIGEAISLLGSLIAKASRSAPAAMAAAKEVGADE